jgi:hypothetical protein
MHPIMQLFLEDQALEPIVMQTNTTLFDSSFPKGCDFTLYEDPAIMDNPGVAFNRNLYHQVQTIYPREVNRYQFPAYELQRLSYTFPETAQEMEEAFRCHHNHMIGVNQYTLSKN